MFHPPPFIDALDGVALIQQINSRKIAEWFTE